MEKITKLYQWLYDEGVLLFDRALPFSNPKTKSASVRLTDGGDWGIFVDAGRIESRVEEYSTMLHESGHYATGTTHAVSSPFELVERHEYRADKWAVERLLTAEELDEAVAGGCSEMWELAEYFGVPEEFMRKAVCWYTYGNLAVEEYMKF